MGKTIGISDLVMALLHYKKEKVNTKAEYLFLEKPLFASVVRILPGFLRRLVTIKHKTLFY